MTSRKRAHLSRLGLPRVQNRTNDGTYHVRPAGLGACPELPDMGWDGQGANRLLGQHHSHSAGCRPAGLELRLITGVTVTARRQLLRSTASYAGVVSGGDLHRSFSSSQPPHEVGTVFFPFYREGHRQIEVEGLLDGTWAGPGRARIQTQRGWLRAPASSSAKEGAVQGAARMRRQAVNKAIFRTTQLRS